MTKKKKIILSSVIVGVVLIGVILTIILVNIKRFDMKATEVLDFNNHTHMTIIEQDPTYTYQNESSLYKGGTDIIIKPATDTTSMKMGLYSYVKNRNVVDVKYDDISPITGNTKTTKSYFRCSLASQFRQLVKIVDEDGEDLSFLNYDEENGVTTSEIKSRTIDLSHSKNSVKSKINKKYHNETIKISSAQLVSGDTYKCCYTDGDTYTYEIWELTTLDNLKYINLYEIVDGKHQLIQTLNNQLGVSLESQNFELMFLTDGTPILLNTRAILYNNSSVQALEYEIYDINFNLKGSSQLNYNVIMNMSSAFIESSGIQYIRVGDCWVFQTEVDATKDKYDYYQTDALGTKYYSLKTFKLNLKNADIMEVSFNYKINKYTSSFNTKTILLSTQKITNKQLTSYENLLINERFQIKKIDYSFDSITQINNNRFVTYSTSSSGGKYNYNLIDKNYNIIAHLENFSELYATKNALIVIDDNTAYICNFDGVVINKINKSEFTYLFDENYYLISKNATSASGTFTEYYFEELGLTQENNVYSKNGSSYTFYNNEVENVIVVAEDYATLIIAVKYNGSSYDYDVYNTSGTLLGTITNLIDPDIEIIKLYSDKYNTVLKVGNDKYVVLDR